MFLSNNDDLGSSNALVHCIASPAQVRKISQEASGCPCSLQLSPACHSTPCLDLQRHVPRQTSGEALLFGKTLQEPSQNLEASPASVTLPGDQICSLCGC